MLHSIDYWAHCPFPNITQIFAIELGFDLLLWGLYTWKANKKNLRTKKKKRMLASRYRNKCCLWGFLSNSLVYCTYLRDNTCCSFTPAFNKECVMWKCNWNPCQSRDLSSYRGFILEHSVCDLMLHQENSKVEQLFCNRFGIDGNLNLDVL